MRRKKELVPSNVFVYVLLEELDQQENVSCSQWWVESGLDISYIKFALILLWDHHNCKR
jgi:hypothetical protein